MSLLLHCCRSAIFPVSASLLTRSPPFALQDKVVSQTYDRAQDTFRTPALVLPCLLLALLVNHAFTLTEVRFSVGPASATFSTNTVALSVCWISLVLTASAFRISGPVQVLWTFSIYLEAVAILPQLVLMQRTQNIDNLTGNYVFLLGWDAGQGRLRLRGTLAS